MAAAKNTDKPASVKDYIQRFPPAVRARLVSIRELILFIAPEAVESIAYGMPAYKIQGKPLVYFAAYEHHIGLYATPAAHTRYAAELKRYKQGKGSVQFPLDQPLPLKLITEMIRFKRAEIVKQQQ
jgi:uncharacterized protein YdhG (YjbR/CyaY superfamily)